MDASLFKIVYSLGSLISLIVNFAVLVAALFALQRKMRQSILLIALGSVLGLVSTLGGFFLYSVFSGNSTPWISGGLQALFALHNILWAIGTILLLMEAKADPVPAPPPL